jgi:AcrR family transcriptional regulator
VPIYVDHEKRREAIIDATWRIIEKRGFDGVSMRHIASEAGFANGSLTPYFTNKDEILEAAFARVTDLTMRRAQTRSLHVTGVKAIREFCLEIMPIDDPKIVEARIVIAFWDRALVSPTIRALLDEAWDSHRQVLERLITDARVSGEITTTRTDASIIDALTWFITGLQSRVLFAPHHTSSSRQVMTFDMLLEALIVDAPND